MTVTRQTVDFGPSSGALTRLRVESTCLPKVLRRLAEYILSNPREVLYQSVTELGDAARAGEASVIRLCRDIGFRGFQDFKLALAVDLAQQAVSATNVISATASLDKILDHAFAEAQQNLQQTRTMIDLRHLEAVISLFLASEQVIFHGVGASGVTARDYAYKFLRLGYTAVTFDDTHLAAMAAANPKRGLVFVGITRSGETVDVVRTMEIARDHGTPTVVITSRPRSPATKVADQVLLTPSSESPITAGSIAAKLGQLLLLDVIYNSLFLRRKQSAQAVEQTGLAVTGRNY